jgi:hypothetical protein
MGIDEIKRWQWIVIGLIVGVCMGFAWTSGEPTYDGRLSGQLEFERDLLRKHPKTSEPVVRNIVIHPKETDFQKKTVQVVTFERLYEGAKTHKTYYQPQQFVAPVPYRQMVGLVQAPLAANATVGDFLKAVGANQRGSGAVGFRYGWESERPIAITLWTAGMAVLVGGVWPTLINLMVGAGFAGAREKKKEEDYFARFSRAPEKARAPEPAGVVSDEERQRLDEMNRRLEAQLQAAGVIADPNAPDVEDPEGKILAPGVRKLEGGALELTPVAKTGDEDDEIEVKGEYYPVLIHHHKKHDEPEKQEQPAAGEAKK